MAFPTSDNPVVDCYHCGDACRKETVQFDDKSFCCDGCKTVYQLLQENNLCNYYSLDKHAGISPKIKNFQGRFAFLDDASVVDKLLQFSDGKNAIVIFNLPQIHCSSCIWLLEHLYKLDPGITQSQTNFLQKEIKINFLTEKTSVRRIVELLATLGYEPLLHLENLEHKPRVNPLRKRVYRIAVSGFCFANIMMLSFPEYFHIIDQGDDHIQTVFSGLNLLLSLPVLIYGGGEFFKSAWSGLKARMLNIDLGLSLSIGITFGRSLYEIFSGTGAGYLDSMSGIIFFMLVGRYFQEKTHYALQFDRNYKSFFPISVSVKSTDGSERSVPLTGIKIGDVLTVRSHELVPADCKCLSDRAQIDYSFVTGESRPVKVSKGEIIYAGGKQTGGLIECEVLREVSQSYLTDLWNNEAFSKSKKDGNSFVQKLAQYFTVFLLALSVGSFFYWLPFDSSRGLNALTTVLIVACPCALLLSATFTNGAMMRIYGRLKVYLKNSDVLESLSKTTEVVLDKTGTITDKVQSIRFNGTELDINKLSLVCSLAGQSNHPLSRALAEKFSFCDTKPVVSFTEFPGKGVSGIVDGFRVLIGSAGFAGLTKSIGIDQSTSVHLSIEGEYLGYFTFEKNYRPRLKEVITDLKNDYKVSILSGDNDQEKTFLKDELGSDVDMYFSQSPSQKMDFVETKQGEGKNVLMIGDGLNDAGALKLSSTGIAISDDVNNFSPACDAIMEGGAFEKLPDIIRLSRKTQNIIKASFVLSLCYNVVGLSFAVSGTLSPVVAAILMPASSISIILFTTGLSWLVARPLLKSTEK